MSIAFSFALCSVSLLQTDSRYVQRGRVKGKNKRSRDTELFLPIHALSFYVSCLQEMVGLCWRHKWGILVLCVDRLVCLRICYIFVYALITYDYIIYIKYTNLYSSDVLQLFHNAKWKMWVFPLSLACICEVFFFLLICSCFLKYFFHMVFLSHGYLCHGFLS